MKKTTYVTRNEFNFNYQGYFNLKLYLHNLLCNNTPDI